MSDIAKCLDSLCPSKDYCYRFTAPASLVYQSYGGFSREQDADNCEMFWPNGKCRYCGLENGIHKMGCETRKIQVNL
jgi:hypothetical protein